MKTIALKKTVLVPADRLALEHGTVSVQVAAVESLNSEADPHVFVWTCGTSGGPHGIQVPFDRFAAALDRLIGEEFDRKYPDKKPHRKVES